MALEALFVIKEVRLRREDDCCTKTLDLKNVTGLTSIYKLIIGILFYITGEVLLSVLLFSFHVCHFVHYSLIKNNKHRVRIYCLQYPSLTDKLYLNVFLPIVFLRMT